MSIVNFFLEDRSRWFLWWPVGMGTGIVFYFSLWNEPSLMQAFAPFSTMILLTILSSLFKEKNLSSLCLIPLSITLGFAVAKIRTDSMNRPFLKEKIENVKGKGRLIDIEENAQRYRLTLDQLTFSNSSLTLSKIRITLPRSYNLSSQMGDIVSFHASLLPLSDPVSVNGYHFRQQAYFQGIQAIGRLKNAPHIVKNSNQYLLSSLRYQLTQILRHHLPDQSGEIATALITGDRSGIYSSVRQDFTDAGLSHILAISGLHLTLVAGLIFLIFRRGLTLIPFLAETYHLKKIVAFLAMLGTFAYLAISGFGIPGQRAFIMVTVIMIGILLDRNPFSLRLVAISASFILLIRPESLLSPSFQLSFAAVIGLIAAYEGGWVSLRQWSFDGGIYRRILLYGISLLSTTLIATLATLPYTIATFNRFSFQALVGNFLAIPLTSLFIMPMATLSVFSLLWGGNDFCFTLLSFGITQLMKIAQTVSSWPGSSFMVPTPSFLFLILTTGGGVWLCLWKNPLRWMGLVFCIAGYGSLYFPISPTLSIAADGSVIAYQERDVLYVSDMKRGVFFTHQWMKESGLKKIEPWPKNVVKLGPLLVVNSQDRLEKHMCDVKILITTKYAHRYCHQVGSFPEILIDRATLKQNGTHQIWLKDNKILIKSVRESLKNRPWNF